MGGKSRKSGGISKALVQRLTRKYQKEQKEQNGQVSTSSGKSQPKSQLLDE